MVERVSCIPWAARVVPLLIVLSMLGSGCASMRKLPADLDLGKAGIVQVPADPVLAVNGLPGKAAGAGVGAATGIGAGVVAGSMACVATGPLFALCIATVVPTTMAIGAFTGVAVGATRTESAEALESKRSMLQKELAAASYPTLLVQHLQRQARDDFFIDLPLLDEKAVASPQGDASRAAGVERKWLIEVALTDVGTDGKQPFALRVEARLKLRRIGEPTAAYEVTHEATSKAALTTEEWGADGAAAVRSSLDQSLQLLAHDILRDLRRSHPR